jgi:hypothetical protein
LGIDEDSLVKYKINTTSNSYNVSLSKKNRGLLEPLSSKELVLNYNLLYPYYFLKSTGQCKITPPIISEIRKNTEWQVFYAS